MKRLIKLMVVAVLFGIFSFSSNPKIVKVRSFTLKKGKELFDLGIKKLENYGEKGEKVVNMIK